MGVWYFETNTSFGRRPQSFYHRRRWIYYTGNSLERIQPLEYVYYWRALCGAGMRDGPAAKKRYAFSRQMYLWCGYYNFGGISGRMYCESLAAMEYMGLFFGSIKSDGTDKLAFYDGMAAFIHASDRNRLYGQKTLGGRRIKTLLLRTGKRSVKIN